MKPYEDLTYLGRARRMRPLARAALKEYGLPGAQFRLLRIAGNTLFRVIDRDSAAKGPSIEPFLAGHYLLRIQRPGYQTAEAILLELEWLAALRRDAELPVPEPVASRDGRLMVTLKIPGIPGQHACSLSRWVKGRFVGKHARPSHFRAQGRLMARLHNHAASWVAPPGLTKKRYDWDGLFHNDDETGLPARDVWPLLPTSSSEPFEIVATTVREVMKAWGEGPDVFGIIHADLGVDANVLFRHGEARAIDFDDSGFGYWIYDLAISLEHCWEDPRLPEYRDALLNGYTGIRLLPAEQLQHLELFLMAFHVYWSLWAGAVVHLHPEHEPALAPRMTRVASLVKRFVRER